MNQVFFHPEIKTLNLEMAGVPSPFMNSEHTGPPSPTENRTAYVAAQRPAVSF